MYKIREPNPDLRFCWRTSLKFFNIIQVYTFCFTTERCLLHKILDVLLKDCWGPHKGCLGAECRPQNRSWEPLVYTNWIDTHSRVDEGVTVGSCWINRLLFADGLVLLASPQQSSCTRSVFCCVRPSWNENQSPKNEVLLYKPTKVYTNPRQCFLQVSGNTLQQVEKFNYLWLVFTCDRRPGDWYTVWVLCEPYRSVATKRELSNAGKLLVFKSIFVPILTYSHVSWVMTERILTQVDAPKIGFLRRVHGVATGCTEVRLRPVQETSLASPCLNLSYFWIKCPALKKKLTTLLRLFGSALWFGVRGIVPPSLRPWCDNSR